MKLRSWHAETVGALKNSFGKPQLQGNLSFKKGKEFFVVFGVLGKGLFKVWESCLWAAAALADP